ncbi:MAG: hypothetical protein IIX03_01110, partial [Paludibacteraceae bacterium]|nr:hypothetical protein [Paludibacteraceae bacterium]
VAEVEELEPLRQPEPVVDNDVANAEDVLAGIEIVSTQPEDPEQITDDRLQSTDDGQMSLF